MNNEDGDEHGDVNQFWLDRDHLKDVDKVRASVFITHGTQDDNVRFNHATIWWEALKARGVPLKMWITRTGHEDPFEFRRAHWVDTLHRWFDHELQGLANGIMDEPKRRHRDDGRHVCETARRLAGPGHGDRPTSTCRASAPGVRWAGSAASSGGATDTVTWTELDARRARTRSSTSPTGSQANRRVFLSAPLTEPTCGSRARRWSTSRPRSAHAQSNLGALLVAYSPSAITRLNRNDGVVNVPPPDNETCWGESTANDNACYIEIAQGHDDRRDVASVEGHPGLQQPPVVVRADCARPEHQGAVHVPDLPQRRGDPRRQPARDRDRRHLHRVRVDRRDGRQRDHARHQAEQGATADRGRLRGGSRRRRCWRPRPWRRCWAQMRARGRGRRATERGRHRGRPTRRRLVDRQRGTVDDPAATCDPAARRGVRGRHRDGGDLHGDATRTATRRAGTFKVVVTRGSTRTTATSAARCPGTLSLAVGGPAAFGAFTPGLEPRLPGTTMAGDGGLRSAADAADLRTVADPERDGARASWSTARSRAAAGAPGQGRRAPAAWAATSRRWAARRRRRRRWPTAGPVSSDAVSIGFKQSIGSTDALRTGTYSKSLTFTLSTTTP